MLIIPAIDIREGKCVRLEQGDPRRQTTYYDNPLDAAKNFEDLGAKLIHVVDLDGAFDGHPVNHGLISSMAGSLSIPIEVGGGIRNEDAIIAYKDSGINRIILGTVILNKEFESTVQKYSDVLIAGIDAKNLMVATHGWKKVSDVNAIEIIKNLKKSGIREIIYTDIATDGMMKGPNFNALEKILSSVDEMSVIASGGVSSIEDIKRLKEMESSGLKGCIVGKAVYDGKIDLASVFGLFN